MAVNIIGIKQSKSNFELRKNMKRIVFVIFNLFIVFSFFNCASTSVGTGYVNFTEEKVYTTKNRFYTFKIPIKPVDVDENEYDKLYEIHLQVIDALEYDYDKLNDVVDYDDITKEEILMRGKGVCRDYTNLFMQFSHQAGVDKNLFEVGTDWEEKGGHAWLHYKTKKHTYIIDPTWCDVDASTNTKGELELKKFAEAHPNIKVLKSKEYFFSEEL